MDEYQSGQARQPTLPTRARLPINHCNLPAVILGSLTFQYHPVPLRLDGVATLHATLFDSLKKFAEPEVRAEGFRIYMRSVFLLDHPDEAGLERGRGRDKADYLRMLRGWLFDPDGREAAVLKSWVESRFGLTPCNHGGALGDGSGDNYQRYLTARARGLYNTNALEAQLDLLYTYCQYELARRYPDRSHLTLYRGVNRIHEHEILEQPDRNTFRVVLNNLNSFTGNRDRADEFGDTIVEADVPLAKLLYFPTLLPEMLHGEEEHLVIGGVYELRRLR